MFRALTILAAIFMVTPALADQPPPMPKPIEAGPAHAGFKKMAGNWNVEQTMYMPDGKSMTAKGKQTVTAVLNGMGVAFDYEGSMGPAGKMLGHGFQTWVPAKSKYESYWFDNFSHHGGSHGWGTWDEKTKTMTETMKGPGPDGKEMTFKMVTKVESDDKHTMDMFTTGPDGKEMKMMTLVYTRAK